MTAFFAKKANIDESFLAHKLLRVVFSIYILVAVSITGLQLAIEYELTNNELED